ncbi:amino acid ABC transporter permease [Labrys neptuniae]
MSSSSTAQTDAIFIPTPARPAPRGKRGLVHWLRTRLFYSVPSTLFTLAMLYVLYAMFEPFYKWAVTDAVWQAGSRRECFEKNIDGACWAGVFYWFDSYMYGRYPALERWRVDVGGLLLVLWVLPIWLPRVMNKMTIAVSTVLIYPFLGVYLFLGGDWPLLPRALAMLGLSFFAANWISALLAMGTGRSLSHYLGQWVGLGGRHPSVLVYPMLGLHVVLTAIALMVSYRLSLPLVETPRWGGLFLTFIIAIGASVFAFPLGLLLALGRRSELPVLRGICVTLIEVIRSVPLVTLLFMVIVLLPLFLPVGVSFDKLMQAMVGISVFTAVYIAEVVRGGLQALPPGQYEAASALGLGYWRTTYLVTMPQALKTMMPVLVSHFIGNLKDTTLVSIVGMYDLLGMLSLSGQNPEWNGLQQEPFFFGTSLFFILCYCMSRYGRRLERRGSGVTGGV